MTKPSRRQKPPGKQLRGLHRLISAEVPPQPPQVAGTSFSKPLAFVGLPERIEAIVRLYETQRKAAKSINRTAETLQNWSSGSTPPQFEPLARLALEKGVSLAWLATGEGPMYGGELAPEDFVYIPRYELRVGAGLGQLVVSEDVKDFMAFQSDWVRSRLRRNPANLAVFEAYGDSMYPTISDGDIMLVDTSEDRVRGNAIYMVLAGNEAIVKRVELKIDGSLLVKSDNPAYETQTLSGDQVPDLRILGKVVWTGGVV